MAKATATASRSKKMSASEVMALVSSQKSDSLHSFQSSALQNDRSKALDYYLGDMAADMPTLPDRSTAVSTDVRDTIEGLMPSLMEIFASGDEVVRFEPVGAEDEEAAQQETDYVNHVFLHQNPGWLILYTYIKDALLSKVGITKVYWGKESTEERETYYDLDGTAFGLLISDENLEIVAHTERPDPTPAQPPAGPSPPAGASAGEGGDAVSVPPSPMLHDVIVAKRKEYGCLKVENVPPEEFGISRHAKSIGDATYCFHESRSMTRSELIEMGFDKKQVMALPVSTHSDDKETLARDTIDESDDASNDGSVNHLAEKPPVTEHYVEMDYDGDGVARLYRVVTGGTNGEVLKRDGQPEIVQIDVKPFAAMTPVIITHRFFGLSIADLVSDIQRQKTALTRAMLDNIYLANNQRLEVAEEGATRNTIDDVLDNKPGGIVRTKRVGSIAPIPNTPIGDFTMPLVQYLDATREWRTGVTRQGQGIEADALQNQTAEAVTKVFTAAQARMRLMARIFAETGVRDLFSLVHQTIRKNDDKANTVRLRNKWVDVDPRVWKNRKDMTITVGIGSGSREQMMQLYFAILNLQKEALANPGTNLVQPQNIYNTLKRIVDNAGLPGVEPYFNDPMGKEYEPPPSPEAEKLKADIQIKQQELQMKQKELEATLQMKKFDGQLKMEEAASKREIEKLQANADVATQDRKVASEIALAERKFELDRQLKILDAQIKQAQAGVELENSILEGAATVGQEIDKVLAQALKAKVGEASANNDAEKAKEKANGKDEQMMEMMKELTKALTRERKIIRDPETGRAVGLN